MTSYLIINRLLSSQFLVEGYCDIDVRLTGLKTKLGNLLTINKLSSKHKDLPEKMSIWKMSRYSFL